MGWWVGAAGRPAVSRRDALWEAGCGAVFGVPGSWHCHEKLWRVGGARSLFQNTAGRDWEGSPGEPSESCGWSAGVWPGPRGGALGMVNRMWMRFGGKEALDHTFGAIPRGDGEKKWHPSCGPDDRVIILLLYRCGGTQHLPRPTHPGSFLKIQHPPQPIPPRAENQTGLGAEHTVASRGVVSGQGPGCWVSSPPIHLPQSPQQLAGRSPPVRCGHKTLKT